VIANAGFVESRMRLCPAIEHRLGASRIDVLAGLVLILLLSGLLVQTLPSLRESARRRSCQANLRRIGQALCNYHDSYRCLPPAAVWSSDGIDVRRFLKVVDTLPLTHENWAICLLPFLDTRLASDCSFDPRFSIMASQNTKTRESSRAVFVCRSDAYNRADNPYVYEPKDRSTRVSFSRGNYAINGGSHSINLAPGSLRSPLPDGFYVHFDVEKRAYQWWGIGVAGINKSLSFDDFQNGLATTVMVDEVRAGIHPMDPRGTWTLGQFGASITWAHGVGGDAVGPNPKLTHADDILRGDELHKMIGADRIAAEGMTFCDHCTKNEQASARSQHPNGVNVLMASGTVQFIADDIDPGVWHLIHSRETPAGVLRGVADSPPSVGDHHEAEAGECENLQSESNGSNPDVIVNSLKMRFKRIPAGKFIMGLPDEGNAVSVPEECPAHEVTISRPFYMGVFEVTQEEFALVMKRNPRSFAPDLDVQSETKTPNAVHYPVNSVTWDEADEFCRSLSARAEEVQARRKYRLPTEAEWEYCCRSGSTEPFHYSATWEPGDKSGEFGGKPWTERPVRIKAVGSYSPNAFGLFDMRGNVWEWCSDWFARDYYDWSSRTDPQGPAAGFQKVFRGTDWIFTGDNCKTRSLTAAPWQCSRFIGFRVVSVRRSQS
jgi:formylglycine-generating enzyme required for sulfatase activity